MLAGTHGKAFLFVRVLGFGKRFASGFCCFVAAVVLALGLLSVAGVDVAHAASSARIHVWGGSAYTDAIILESDGRFGLVDAGEDNDRPDGSNPLYPLRAGITIGAGIENDLVSYMRRIGVTEGNLEFVIVTHPHSDHAGGADTVIRAFKPERVYLQEYSDDYITNPAALWDNLYVYDQTLEAAEGVGAVVIQRFDEDAPIVPEDKPEGELPPGETGGEGEGPEGGDSEGEGSGEDAIEGGGGSGEGSEEPEEPKDPEEPEDPEIDPHLGNPKFPLGSMDIEIMNYGDGYKAGQPDANYFSLGVKVVANGKTAFLSGDINNFDGDEDRLVAQLGKVDVLKMGHHGVGGSNTLGYLRALDPSVYIQTGWFRTTPAETFNYIVGRNARHYTTQEAMAKGASFIVVDLAPAGVVCNLDDGRSIQMRRNDPGPAINYCNGRQVALSGWQMSDEGWRYFEGSPYAVSSRWISDGGKWYWVNAQSNMVTGWEKIDGSWYYFNKSGVMQTGWQKVGGKWYYLKQGGQMQTGWLKLGKTWYYLNDSGAMATGWAQVGGKWYYMNGSGAMKTGWQKVGKSWYYLNSSGAMKTGWFKEKGTWYFLKDSGAMATGWYQVDGTWYWSNSSGAMAANRWIGNYYVKSNGAMATSQWIGRYHVDANGKWDRTR